MHYSSINYWTPGWIYPRSRLREPFPRRRRGFAAAVFAVSAAGSSTGTPERTFVGLPRGLTFAPTQRGTTFSGPPRGVVFGAPMGESR